MIFEYNTAGEYERLLLAVIELGVDFIDDSYEDGVGCIEADVELESEISFLVEAMRGDP